MPTSILIPLLLAAATPVAEADPVETLIIPSALIDDTAPLTRADLGSPVSVDTPLPAIGPGTVLEAQGAAESEARPRQPYGYASFARQTHAVRWEVSAAIAAITATRLSDVTTKGSKFHFVDEGYFGKGTYTLGMDKMHHAYKTAVIADVLDVLIRKRTGETHGVGKTGAILSLGLLTYGEILDGFTARTGFSNEDMVVHFAGAGFSLLRNSVPGMRDKLDFRMLTIPTFKGQGLQLEDQLAKRKYLLAAQLGGFKRWEKSPLRFMEVHLGYYGRGFTERDKLAGAPLKRRVFLGLGFNMQALFAKRPAGRIERLAKGVLDYIQVPYTLIH